MAKKEQDKSGFSGVYLQGEGPGVMARLPFLFDEDEEEKKEEVSSDDVDTSHLSDMRHHKSSSHSPVRKKKHPYSFVR